MQSLYVTSSIPYDGGREKKYILEQHDKKKNFITKKGFTAACSSDVLKSYEIPNYVMRTPGQNPMLHKFRENSQEKNVCDKDFIVY